MSYYDIGLYVILGLAAILGYTFGFAKALRKLTKGIKGLIIVIVLCFAFGGFLSQFSFAQQLITMVDDATASFPAFLSFIPYGHVAFYIALGIIFLIVRAILISIIDAIFGRSQQVMIVGRIFGLVLYAAYYAALILVVLAVMKMFESTSFVQDILVRITGSNLEQIYLQNPVVF
jgi:hypothetical protein